jgi:hypothetical protein
MFWNNLHYAAETAVYHAAIIEIFYRFSVRFYGRRASTIQL